MTHEEQTAVQRLPGGQGVFGLKDVVKGRRAAEFTVGTAEAPAIQGEWQRIQEFDGIGTHLLARPQNNIPGLVIEKVRRHLATHHRIVISQDEVIDVGVGGFQHGGRVGSVPHDIAKANDAVDANTANIQQGGIPRLKVRMQIRYNRVSHGGASRPRSSPRTRICRSCSGDNPDGRGWEVVCPCGGRWWPAGGSSDRAGSPAQ